MFKKFATSRDPVATAKLEVIRGGKVVETIYSVESIPLHHIRRRLKAWKHLRFLKQENRP